MKLTADQREQLIEAMKRDFIDTMTGNVHRDRVATLIESWLSSPPEGWEWREEWECLTGEARSTLHAPQEWRTVPSEWVTEWSPEIDSPLRKRTVWESPWEDA